MTMTAQDIVDRLLEMRRQNRYNPKGLRRNHRGQLLDKWGREMEVDWDEFERKRRVVGEPLKSPKVLNPLHAAAIPKKI